MSVENATDTSKHWTVLEGVLARLFRVFNADSPLGFFSFEIL